MRSRSLPARDEHDRRPAGETAARDERLRPDQAAVLALSSGAGNQAVARWLLQRQDDADEVDAEDAELEDEEVADEEPGSDADVDFLEAAEAEEVVASAISAEPEPETEAEQEAEAEEPEESEPAVLARMPVRSAGTAVLARGRQKRKRVSNWPLKLPATAVQTTWKKYRTQVKTQSVAALVFPDATAGAAEPFVITVDLPKLATRADAVAIRASAAAIAKHMNMFSKRLMGIGLPKKYKKLAQVTARTTGSWRAKVTEGVGELAATQYVMAHFPGYELISGFGPGRGIDQLWKSTDANGDVEYLVVEAKGPGQDLTGTEMTPAWVLSRARQLGTDDGDEIVDALEGNGDAEVRGVILVARWFKGKLSPTTRWPKGTNKGWYT